MRTQALGSCEALFFGLVGDAVIPPDRYAEAFMFDGTRSFGHGEVGRETALLVEASCSADHGAVQSYEEINGRWTPVLVSQEDEAAIRWGIRLVHDVVARFASNVQFEFCSAPSDLRAMSAQVLSALWDSPALDEAAAWATFPIADDPSGVSVVDFGRPYTWGQIFAALYTGTLGLSHPCAWPAVSLQASSRTKTAFLSAGLAAREMASKARRAMSIYAI
jgi:hypothetical protein